jgi:hypothetical protein
MTAPLTLIFTQSGHAILEEEGDQTWASDDDEDFSTEIGDDFLDEEDATTVLNYLTEHDIISEREAQMMVIEVEENESGSRSDSSSEHENVIDADYVDLGTLPAGTKPS